MTASSPAAPDPRTETIRQGIGAMGEPEWANALAALASLDAELTQAWEVAEAYKFERDRCAVYLAATRQALEQIADHPLTRPLAMQRIARAVLAGEDTA